MNNKKKYEQNNEIIMKCIHHTCNDFQVLETPIILSISIFRENNQCIYFKLQTNHWQNFIKQKRNSSDFKDYKTASESNPGKKKHLYILLVIWAKNLNTSIKKFTI